MLIEVWRYLVVKVSERRLCGDENKPITLVE